MSDSRTVTGDIYVCYIDATMADNVMFELPDIENDVNETDILPSTIYQYARKTVSILLLPN